MAAGSSSVGRLLCGLAGLVCLAAPAAADIAAAPTTPAATDSRAPIAPPASPAAAAPTEIVRGQLRFRVFGGAERLKNLVIVSIVQDGDGFLWLATDDGVYRYDGERFSHFSISDGLVSSSITTLGVDPDGKVCVGSAQGLVCWDGARFSQASTRGLPPHAVLSTASFADRFWIGTDGGGLYVRSRGGVFAPAPGWPMPTASIRGLWADAAGIVAASGDRVQLSIGDGRWKTLDAIPHERDRIDGVLRDHDGALWIRTPSHMWFYPPGAAHATDLRQDLANGYDATAVSAPMVLDARGVLVATDLGVAYREAGRWQMIDRSVGLPATGVRTLFVDREGTIWLGSTGLFQLRRRGLFERHAVGHGFPGDVAWHYARDPAGTLWAGTSQCLARAERDRWTCLPGTEGRVVRSFVFPPQGGVFLGGAPSDLLYIDPSGRAASVGDLGRAADHNILALALRPQGDRWVATKAGLYRLRGAVPGPLEPVEIPGAPSDGRFASLVVDGDRLWTASDDGLFVYEHGTWRAFDQTAGFRSAGIAYIVIRADGRVCVAYSEAIGASCARYDGRQLSSFEHIGVAEGLGTGKIYFLGEDRQRRLWIGTGGGVDVVSEAGVEHFEEGDGLAGDDAAANAFLSDTDGSVWLGSTGGTTHVRAQDFTGPPRPPRTTLLDGKLGELSIHRGATGALEAPHDRSALRLEFAAGSLVDATRVTYQIRLSPLETEWGATHLREARYPSLLPGAYRFEVRARVDAGAWGPTTALAFRVLPAWWQTRWFLGLALLVGLAALGTGFTWRQRAVLRRRTRQLHAQSDTSFRALIDGMPDLISVYRDRKLVYLNEATRRFLGVDGSEASLADLDLIDRVHPDDRPVLSELFRKVRQPGSAQSTEIVEIRMRSADGGIRLCEISGVLVEMGGSPTVVASGRDVTERKRLRAKLMVSDRMASLGTLAAGIAHEINNPLAYVTGNLEALAELVDAPATAGLAELRSAIDDARDGAERVRKIVQGLRSFTRSEEEAQRVAIALPGVLEAAIRMTANEVRHRAELVCELAPLPQVIADDGKLTQVFINLLINAAHAIPEGHSERNRITVRTRTDDHGRAVIEIEDTGHGIAPELQARVFDPFFTTKGVGEGTGLGLSICHGIISGLGGQISLESAPTRGTIVRVVLPAAPTLVERPEAPPAPPAIEPAAPRRLRVMLVDDEPMVAQTIERLLRRDYDITIASCGHDALAQLHGGARFDAIVSDVMMPNMTGLDLFEELLRTWPDQAARVVFLSGGAFTAQTRDRLDALGIPQLEKPVTAKELRACVRRIAGEADKAAAPAERAAAAAAG